MSMQSQSQAGGAYLPCLANFMTWGILLILSCYTTLQIVDEAANFLLIELLCEIKIDFIIISGPVPTIVYHIMLM